jgi:Calcineurin-like phosphoesterase
MAGMGIPAAFATPAQQLRRYPYLTDALAGGVTVNWGTDQSQTTGTVTWGAGGEPCLAHAAPATRATVNVNGVLEYHWRARIQVGPGTSFCYRVFAGAVDLLGTDPSPQASTQVPPGSTAPYSFAVFGDWGRALAAGNPGQAGVMGQIAASGARFAIGTGDTGYPAGNQANYGDLQQSGDNISGVFAPDAWTVAGSRIPMFNAVGNHGFNPTFLSMWPTDNAATASGGAFSADSYCCTNGTSPATYPSAWYAFDQGNARFYILDAAWADTNVGSADPYKNDYDNHWTPASAEYRWLEQDLATHASALKFAAWHYPLYADDRVEHSDTFLQGPGSLEGLLNRYGVDLAFNGHTHVYQRNRAAPGGLITYVTGGGGADLGTLSACSAIDAYAIGWSTSADTGRACGAATPPSSPAQVFHFLLVTVNGTQVTVTPTDSTGRIFDVQSYDFAAPAATTPGGTVGPSAPGQGGDQASRLKTALAARFRTVRAKKAQRRTGGRKAGRIVDGRLTDAARQPLAGQTVALHVRPRFVGGQWKTLRTARTDAHGRVSFRVPPSPSLDVQLVLAETPTLAAAVSPRLHTRVAGRSTIHVDRARARVGQIVTFSGRALEGHVPRGGRVIVLQRYAPTRRLWLRVGPAGLRTDAAGGWRRRTKAPATGLVRYRLRLVARPDVPFAEGFSHTLRLLVLPRR